ncbi:MAG: hypothetical protein IPM82_21415 [Saprospiraceae bacterium]|nr:hypothetical protein [Saprospiraceae bacterium]
MEQLESTQLNMRDFKPFHAWQSNWLGLGSLGQKVVRALVKVKPGDWVAAFESWYFNSLLAKAHRLLCPKAQSKSSSSTLLSINSNH